jgi:molybdopterin/thiamine biosynthesis adenylyltransferase
MLMNFADRYSRNQKSISEEDQSKLATSTVAIVGCGGLGGYVVEMLGRLGVGHIVAIDGDVFEESNLNRQILSDVESLGVKKAEKAAERMKRVNPLIEVIPVAERLNAENGKEILKGADVVVDALDNIETRLMLERLCEEMNIPLVHGAIGGWYGQVTTVLPGDRTLSRFYTGKASRGIEQELGNPSFTPALVASIEVCETIKLLIKRGEVLSKKLLIIDLLEQEYNVIEL